MGTGKRIYGYIVLFFVVICYVIFVGKGCVYASSYANRIGSIDDSVQESSKTSDNNNDGFSFIWNNESGSLSAPLKMLIVLTVISLAPSILIMLTSFTRIIVVLHFVRTALGTQTSPPNQVMVGLALFLTLFIMSPVFSQVNENAIQPLDRNEITLQEALDAAQIPFREFMYGETQKKRH